MEMGVTIPLAWFLSGIGSLCVVIGVMAKAILSIQEARIAEANKRTQYAREDAKTVSDALNQNTTALNNIVTAIQIRSN